jgi:hypothetical protein
MHSLIEDSGYKKLRRNPLPKMKKEANAVIKEVAKQYGERFKWRLCVSNPQVPKLYGLLKIPNNPEIKCYRLFQM